LVSGSRSVVTPGSIGGAADIAVRFGPGWFAAARFA